MKICSICLVKKPINELRPKRKQCFKCLNARRKFRYHNDHTFKSSISATSKRTAIKYSEKYKKSKQLYRVKNKDRIAIRMREHLLKKQYSLTFAQYDSMLKEQGGVCKICKTPPKGKCLAVDHDPKTGRVRSLLCIKCNVNFVGNHTIQTAVELLLYLKSYE